MRVRELDYKSDEELEWAVRTHCEIPRHWDPAWDVSFGYEKQLESLRETRSSPDRLILVAESDPGEHVGLHWVNVERSNPLFRGYSGLGFPPGESVWAHIMSLWVREDHWGQGIASELKAKAEIWARSRGARRIATSVHSRNTRMMELNRRAGFEFGNVAMSKPL